MLQHSIAALTALLSGWAWAYRYIDEHTPDHFWLYALVPLIVWLLFLAPLYGLRARRKWLRVVAAIALLPAAALLALSVLIGFEGLRIH